MYTSYLGTKEWDGPRKLSDMFGDVDEELLPFIPDYRINLLAPREITDFTGFRTSIRQLFEVLKNAYDKEKMQEVLRRFSKSALLTDLAATARNAGSQINAVMLGALAGSHTLPIEADIFRAAIRAEGKAVDANLVVPGSVMASDAFFPFRDGIDAAAEAGIKAVIQPGGSMRDNEVIAAADEHGIAMVFTGVRHFRH